MKANLLDRAIGYVSPRTALRRMKSRAAYDAARGYDAGALGRHTDGWRAGPTSADTEIASAGSRIRDRHRDLVRNNPHAAKAVSTLVTNIIGEGIMPRTQDKKVMAAFTAWCSKCDADGQLDFFGLQTLAVREMVEGGECLIRRRVRRGNDGLDVPLQLQVLEADLLDGDRNGPIGAGGNTVIQGVEFNAIGRRQAYWMFAEHPGNLTFSTALARSSSYTVPATELIHLYEKQRTQVRGVPWGAPVIRSLKDLADYKVAEGLRKKLESAYVGAIIPGDDDDATIAPKSGGGRGGVNVTDTQGNPIDQFEPGIFAVLRGGKDIKFNAPASVNGYAEYETKELRAIAAGYRIPYELMSGDLSQVNYSSIRSGLLEFRRLVRVIQWQIVIPQMLQPIWDWWCQIAFLSGVIDKETVAVEWDTPRFEWVDPYKDAAADVLSIRAGIRTWQEVVAERGRNPEEVIAEIARFNKLVDAAGLVLDSDPRVTAASGIAQKSSDPQQARSAAEILRAMSEEQQRALFAEMAAEGDQLVIAARDRIRQSAIGRGH